MKELKNRPIYRLKKPFEAFMHLEPAGGIMLIVFTVIAVVWVNSGYANSYHEMLELPIIVGFGGYEFKTNLHHFVNDALMTIFFFIIGLELKREFVEGELKEIKRALVPIFAAIGGMIVPALIYTFLHLGEPTVRGWGIPMATDIAFAVGILVLLGRKVPFSLKIFLLTLAIIDDIGAVLVIALFYTETISLVHLFYAFLGLLFIVFIYHLGVRNLFVYFGVALFVWFAVLNSGVHATITGVVLGLMVPSRSLLDEKRFLDVSSNLIGSFREATQSNDARQKQKSLLMLAMASYETLSMLERLELIFHPWNLFYVLPLFALLNAGVVLDANLVAAPVSMAVILGLFLGKPIGIFLFSYVAVKLKFGKLSPSINWPAIAAVGFLGGIGFTMSIFVSNLAFGSALYLQEAKIGIFTASTISALVGLGLLFALYRRTNHVER